MGYYKEKCMRPKWFIGLVFVGLTNVGSALGYPTSTDFTDPNVQEQQLTLEFEDNSSSETQQLIAEVKRRRFGYIFVKYCRNITEEEYAKVSNHIKEVYCIQAD
jgi:hypothetical protein